MQPASGCCIGQEGAVSILHVTEHHGLFLKLHDMDRSQQWHLREGQSLPLCIHATTPSEADYVERTGPSQYLGPAGLCICPATHGKADYVKVICDMREMLPEA